MNEKFWRLLGCATLLCPLLSHAGTDVPVEPSGMNTWIERPWEIRYFMQLKKTSGWHFMQQLAARNSAKEKQISWSWEILFDPSHIVQIPERHSGGRAYPDDKAVVVVAFDKEGFVTTPNHHQGPLRGRLHEVRRLVMSAGDAPNDRVYVLAHWFTGHDEDTPMEVVPAFCSGPYDIAGPFSATDDRYIYGKLFKATPGDWFGFGCREWAYQLHSSDRPYIDVTTYGPKNKRYPHGNYINDFIGWSTFDARKPVIGRHADTWYCLYECPNGDPPGKIDNINLWAARNGWNPPRPPTRVPTFTDDPQRRGTYVN